jgi:DNA-directed RNA polymerase subunit E'/Rpb7
MSSPSNPPPPPLADPDVPSGTSVRQVYGASRPLYGNGHAVSRKQADVYMSTAISMKVQLKMADVGKYTRLHLERAVVKKTEGKCIAEGFVKPDSVKIVTYSSGVIKNNMVEFHVVFECLVCNPVEGMVIDCVVRTISKAGIHAEVITEKGVVPMKIFVARDHNYHNRLFEEVRENTSLKVRILGKRFELNDLFVVAIAAIERPTKERTVQPNTGRPKITVHDASVEEDIPLDYELANEIDMDIDEGGDDNDGDEDEADEENSQEPQPSDAEEEDDDKDPHPPTKRSRS